MRGQSELELESANDGVRVRLSSGSILVTAAKQRGGHLYVETPDTIVSVVGTVFLVERTSLGTRVGVCEGEVEVARQGLELRKLIPGSAGFDKSVYGRAARGSHRLEQQRGPSQCALAAVCSLSAITARSSGERAKGAAEGTTEARR